MPPVESRMSFIKRTRIRREKQAMTEAKTNAVAGPIEAVTIIDAIFYFAILFRVDNRGDSANV